MSETVTDVPALLDRYGVLLQQQYDLLPIAKPVDHARIRLEVMHVETAIRLAKYDFLQ